MKKLLFVFLFVGIKLCAQCYTNASAKGFHNLTLHSDGTLWVWGQNNYHQLGNNSSVNQSHPTQIATGSNWIKVASGTYHSLGIKSDGTLWAWGSNEYGQIGINGAYTPQMIGTDTDWVYVAAGLSFSVAIKSDGSLWTWGDNEYGQLGNGTTVSSNVPIQVGTGHNWIKACCGSQHVIALKSDGTIWAWGSGTSGGLGQGNLSSKHIPTQIGNGNDWVEICAGYSISFGIKSNGTLWGCGYNGGGNLGVGNTIGNYYSFVQIGTASNWRNITCVYTTMATKTDGTLWAWGRNTYGEVGNGNVGINQLVPVQIGTDNDWLLPISGFEHSTAIKTNGTLYAWGHNNYGQLGDGTMVDKITPTLVGTICNESICSIPSTELPDIVSECAIDNLQDIVPVGITTSCGNTVLPTIYQGNFPIAQEGDTTIIWQYLNNGTSVLLPQVVTIAANAAPVPEISSLPDLNFECNVSFSELTVPEANDACDGIIIGTTDMLFPINQPGSYTISWNFSDTSGNVSMQNQMIIVQDTESPVPQLATLSSINSECSLNQQDIITPIAEDSCIGMVSATTITEFPITTLGEHIIVWSYNDGRGNISTQQQTVVITDTSAPVPTLESLPDIVSECVLRISDIAIPTALDGCTGLITAITDTTFPVDTLGTTQIVWNYNDGNGNTVSQVQNVILQDTEPPVLQLQEAEVSLNEQGIAVLAPDIVDNGSYDTCGAIVSVTISPDSFEGCESLGVHEVTVVATDSQGNSALGIAIVTVNDPLEYCNTSGIAQYDKLYSVYPNPTESKLYINCKDIPTKVSLFTMTGQEIILQSSKNNAGYILNLEELAKGSYLLVIENATGTYYERVILK